MQGRQPTCAQVWGLHCSRALVGRAELEVGRPSLLGTWCRDAHERGGRGRGTMCSVQGGMCMSVVVRPGVGAGCWVQGRVCVSAVVGAGPPLSSWVLGAFSPSKTQSSRAFSKSSKERPLCHPHPVTSAVTSEASHLTSPGFGFFVGSWGGGVPLHFLGAGCAHGGGRSGHRSFINTRHNGMTVGLEGELPPRDLGASGHGMEAPSTCGA